MGLLGDLWRGRRPGVLDAAPLPFTNLFGDGPSHLATVVLSDDLAKILPKTVTRADAMSVPAMAHGHALVTGAIAPLPLRVLNADGPLAEQPTWTYRSDSGVSPYARMIATVGSLMFRGASCWAVKRGADGAILDAAWIPDSRWTVDNSGVIQVDGKPADDRELIYFDHPLGGMLNTGARTLRQAIEVERSVARVARNPIPTTVIRHTETNAQQLEDEEIVKLRTQWQTARQSEDGATAYVPPGLTADALGTVDGNFFTEARNGVRVDIAGMLGMPAGMLDGSVAGASLTYRTEAGERSRFDSECLPTWMGPVEWRLSQDDIVPRGQRVRFDLSDRQALTPPATRIPVED